MHPSPIIVTRSETDWSYSVIRQSTDDYGFRIVAEYGHGLDFEGRLVLDVDPQGNLKWEPHREIPTYLEGWPENSKKLQEALTRDIRRRLGVWDR